jgi:hypothetical protein
VPLSRVLQEAIGALDQRPFSTRLLSANATLKKREKAGDV